MLIGEKVCLGPVLNGDKPLLFNWLNSLRLAQASGAYRPVDETQFSQWLSAFSADPARVMFAIRRHGDLRLLGYVHFTNVHPVLRSAELGIAIGGAADRNQGFGLEAVRLAVAYGWKELNLERVALSVLADHAHARHVYQKAGFELEGVLRRAAYADGQFHDLTLMSILRPMSETLSQR